MIDRYSFRVRRALLSVATAFAGAVAVTAGGWALQAAALPAPRPAAQIAADASVWLHEYRFVVDVFHFRHRRLSGACIRTWARQRDGRQIHASVLSLGPRSIVRVTGKGALSPLEGRHLFPPGLLAADAGCSGRLSGVLAAAAQNGGHLTMERSYAAGQPAVALELQPGRKKRLTVFVSPRTDRPLVVFVDLGGRDITARIYLERATSRALARFGLLRLLRPEAQR